MEKKALAFNIPLVLAAPGSAAETPAASFARADAENIELSAVKQAEDGSGTILRFFETFGRKAEAEITLPAGTARCFLCSLMEKEEQELAIRDGKVRLPFHPFEIQTVKVR